MSYIATQHYGIKLFREKILFSAIVDYSYAKNVVEIMTRLSLIGSVSLPML